VKRVINGGEIKLGDTTLDIQGNDKQGCFVEILERTKSQLDAMLSYHSKIMVVRLDLRMYEYHPNNELISRYIRKVRKKLVAKYGFNRVGFIWAREQEKAIHQHYHFAVFVDANKVRFPKNIVDICSRIWSDWEQSPYTPKNCYYIVRRGRHDDYQKVFYRLSYLSKVRGKGHKSKSANDYSTSRIRLKI